MILRAELEIFLKNLLQPQLFDDYAPNGLQVEGKSSIKKVAFSVSASLECFEQLHEWKADALVVHHGVFWKHQGAKPLVGPFGKKIQTIIKMDLNLFAYHLPLDAHMECGNAISFARLFNLQDPEPFGLYKKQHLGIKASFPIPMKASDFRTILETKLARSVTMASASPDDFISTIGIITGGANNEWEQASQLGLDAYLTGEISEYNWHDAREAGIHYFAAGHHATEKFGIQSLMNLCQKKFPHLEVKFFDSENPV